MEKTSVIQTDLSKYKNDWFSPGRGTLVVVLWFVIGRMLINSYLPIPMAIKLVVLRIFGAQIGEGVVIKPKVNIKYPWRLKIANHVWIGEKVWIDNLTNVSIGNSVCISQGAMLLCGNHNYAKKEFDLMLGEIILEDGVWIGAQSVVCPGVVCQSHSVLSVQSVAVKNLEAFGIYQGNPAEKKKVRKIS